MNNLKDVFKRSRENIEKNWNGSERIYKRLEKKPVAWQTWTAALASFCLIIVSYSIFNNDSKTVLKDSLSIGDLYGDESVDSNSDELEETFDFYDEIV